MNSFNLNLYCHKQLSKNLFYKKGLSLDISFFFFSYLRKNLFLLINKKTFLYLFRSKQQHDFYSQHMSELCEIPACKRISFPVCDCCQRHICQFHINEHYESLNVQLNPLSDELMILNNGLESFDIHKTNIESREKLEQWRVESHEKIDRLFEKKCQELDQYILMKISRQAEQIDHIRSKLNQLASEQGTTTRQDLDFLTSNICRLKKQMNNIEQTFIQINTHPLVIIDTMLQITETIRPKIDLFTRSPSRKTIDHSKNSCSVLTSNNKFLLIHQAPNLCLIDQEMYVVNQILWPFDKITDMCWSSTLERFILIYRNDLFLIDDNIMLIEKISTIQNIEWSSCTCSDASLFLSTNERSSSIMEFNLLPNIELTTHWKSPVTCEKNEQIDSMIYNNGTIALIIRNFYTKSVRIELRFSATLDCLWSLILDIQCDKKIPFHCCSLSFDEWLVADYKNSRLLHITKYGQVKAMITYKVTPFHINLFNQNILVVLTKYGKNLYQFV
jgi:hypothetical protein